MNPNIIFVLLDGARYDRIHTSKDFMELKENGCLFSNVTAAYPYTFPAINSMFTGMFGKENGVDAYYKMFKLKDSIAFLPEILQENGYFTSCDLISDKVISSRGFNIHQSHNEYEDDLTTRHPELIKKSFKEANGKPIFTFLQFSRIHTVTVSEVLKKYEWDDAEFYQKKSDNMKNYDEVFQESVLYAKKIVHTIEKLGKSDETIIIFFSDHGTGVGERFGERNYGVYTYEETIRTFHLFLGMDIVKNHICDKLVSSLQLFPTILDLCQIKSDFKTDLPSLMPYFVGNFDTKIELPYVFTETGGLQGPFPSPEEPNVFCIKNSRYKLIFLKTSKEWKMFDLIEDPSEGKNIFGMHLKEEKILQEKLTEWINR